MLEKFVVEVGCSLHGIGRYQKTFDKIEDTQSLPGGPIGFGGGGKKKKIGCCCITWGETRGINDAQVPASITAARASRQDG